MSRWQSCCCDGAVCMLRYDGDTGDILWQRGSGVPNDIRYSVELIGYDAANARTWYTAITAVEVVPFLMARNLVGSKVAQTQIYIDEARVHPDGGLVAIADRTNTVAPFTDLELLRIDGDGEVSGVYGSYPDFWTEPSYDGFGIASDGDLLFGSPIERVTQAGATVWTAGAGFGGPVFPSVGNLYPTRNGNVIDISDGSFYTNITGLATFNGAATPSGAFGGAIPGSTQYTALMTDTGGDPLWDLVVPFSGFSATADNGAVYVIGSDTSGASGPSSRAVLRKHDGSTGDIIWEQVGPDWFDATLVTASITLDGDGHVVVGTRYGPRITRSEWTN